MRWFKRNLTFGNFIFLGLIIFVVVNRGPVFVKNWQKIDTSVAPIKKVLDIHGQAVTLDRGPYALVFWATWCKPCDIELRRAKKLVDESKINSNQIIAVALDSDLKSVEAAANERGYNFPIVWSNGIQLADYYEVGATPTVIIVGDDNKVKSATTGVSPLLEMRLKKYLD